VGRPHPSASYQIRQGVAGGHRVDLQSLRADRRPRLIAIQGLFLRYEYYRPYKELIRREWLLRPALSVRPDDELTIHVRSGDVWQRGRPGRRVNPEYHTLPFSFYAGIVGRRRWQAIRIVTEDRNDAMVGKLARNFAATVHSGGVLDDFDRLRASSNLVLSVSSFAWWAAWLSSAQTIFFPIAGLFDAQRAACRPPVMQQDLWVNDEDRYVPVRPAMESGPWTGTEQQRLMLLET
jgi:hypothetical protein